MLCPKKMVKFSSLKKKDKHTNMTILKSLKFMLIIIILYYFILLSGQLRIILESRERDGHKCD